LPWTYGIVYEQKITILSFHTIDNRSFTIHSTLFGDINALTLSADEWKKIIYGIILAINYLHNKSILHNDIKTNYVLIQRVGSEIHSILIDLGKGCFLQHGKMYHMNDTRRRRKYKKKYPHTSPDLVDDHCNQSKSSDRFSVGRLIKQINDKHLNVPALESVSKHCTEYCCTERPSTLDIKTTIYNLFY